MDNAIAKRNKRKAQYVLKEETIVSNIPVLFFQILFLSK
jgi:hypothetical protein